MAQSYRQTLKAPPKNSIKIPTLFLEKETAKICKELQKNSNNKKENCAKN